MDCDKIKTIDELGATWYFGEGSLQKCLDNIGDNKFIVAYDYMNDFMQKPTKAFASYKNSKCFYKKTKNIETDMRCFYVVVPEKTPCCLYADLEWDLSWKSIDDIKQKFTSLIIETLKLTNIILCDEEILFSNACEISTNKGSLHAHVPCVFFNNVLEQKQFFNAISIALDSEGDEWFFIDETENSFILKTFIDFGVYNKNREIRLPYCSKKKSTGLGVRAFIPENEEDFDISEWCITEIHHCGDKPVDVSIFPEEITCTKRTMWSKDLIQGVLDTNNLNVSVSTFKGSNLVALKNKQKTRICPINGEINKSDNAYIVIKNNQLLYKCHDEGCKGQSKLIHTFDDKEIIMHHEPPFEKYYKIVQQDFDRYITVEDKNVVINKEGKLLQKRFLEEINKYCVIITGTAKPYVLYRTEILKGGHKVVTWKAKYFPEFTKTYDIYDIRIGTTYLVGVTTYLKSTTQRRYFEEDCRPYENPNDCPPTTFNTYQGFSITKEIALSKCKNDSEDLDFLLSFIKNTWCSGKQVVYDWVLDWMAHLIQKPWIKMQTSLVLQGTEGTGKGMLIQLLGKIIGDAHFFQPTCVDDMFGSFNYLLDNKLFIFADEMFWGGDKKNAGLLKKLLTEKSRTSNCKFAPQRLLTNMLNFAFASNENWIIPAGIRARRYTVLKILQDLYGMTPEQKKRLWNFCPYTFANFLYNRDISKFDPHTPCKTEGLEEQKIYTMSKVHRWIMKSLEDDDLENSKWIAKSDLYNNYMCSNGSTGYKGEQKEMFLELKKIYNFEEGYKKVSSIMGKPKKKVCIYIPEKEILVKAFNDLYDCEIIKTITNLDDENDKEENDHEDITLYPNPLLA